MIAEHLHLYGHVQHRLENLLVCWWFALARLEELKIKWPIQDQILDSLHGGLIFILFGPMVTQPHRIDHRIHAISLECAFLRLRDGGRQSDWNVEIFGYTLRHLPNTLLL